MKYDNKSEVKQKTIRETSRRFGEHSGMKRLTIDVSPSLHANIKARCAKKGIKMADAIRDMLEEEFGSVE